MYIKNEDEIFQIRVDQNNGAYFKAHIGQKFKDFDLTVVGIYFDQGAYLTDKTKIFKVKAENYKGTVFNWKEFIDPSRTELTYRFPDATDFEMIQLIEKEESE